MLVWFNGEVMIATWELEQRSKRDSWRTGVTLKRSSEVT